MNSMLPAILYILLASSVFSEQWAPPKDLSATTNKFVSPHRDTPRNWNGIPHIIESLEKKDYFGSFSDLQEIAHTTTNQVTPSGDSNWTGAEKQKYFNWAKMQWQSWWQTTGSMIKQNRQSAAIAYPQSWKTANQLTRNNVERESVPKIWMPQEWSMVLTFSTGDYGSQEKEQWFISCSKIESVVYRLKANVWNLRPVLLEKCVNITRADLQDFLAILTYVFEYELRNPKVEQPVLKEGDPKYLGYYYYPHGTIRLDSASHSIWNLHGYEHFLFPYQYHSQDPSSLNPPSPLDQSGKSAQKVGLARSIAKALWDENKEWQQVFQLGDTGRKLIRDSFKDSYFSNIKADTYRFVPLAAFGGDEESLLIRKALTQAEKIECGAPDYQDFINKQGYTSKTNRGIMTFGKEMWQAMLTHLEAQPKDVAPPANDILNADAIGSKSLQFLEFHDGQNTASSKFRIAIGLNVAIADY